jgi:hypothetical protein
MRPPSRDGDNIWKTVSLLSALSVAVGVDPLSILRYISSQLHL